MTRYRVEINQTKCQAFGKCGAVAPNHFALDEGRKVRLLGGNETADDAVVTAAKSCPYRVITVADADTGMQIFPKSRR